MLNYLRTVDADDLFSYSTNKVVQVRDRRLGLLYYSFLGCIVLYILFYNLLYEKKYLALDDPTGSFRFSLRRGANPRPLDELPYCLQTQESHNGFPNHECRYYENNLVVYPTTEESAMQASTRITMQGMEAACDFSTPDCGFENTTSPETIFVADIENFTLMIDHAIYSTALELQTNAKDIAGKLVGMDGEAMVLEAPNQVGVPGQYDIIQLQKVLEAAGTTSLDSSDYDNPESLRYAGCILLFMIEYTNMNSFNTSYIEYQIKVRRVADTEFKADEYQPEVFPISYTHWNRHGIRLLFLRLGTVGTFDFQTLLINVIAGSALLGATTYVVDFLAKYVSPERSMYRAYMIQPTPDFSSLRDDPEKMRMLADGDVPEIQSHHSGNQVEPEPENV